MDRSSRRITRSLNDFPDEILCHVISFLPTESAFKTSVLSKRWRFMWKSLTNLKFKERRESYTGNELDKFMNIVERALYFDNAPMLNSFTLDCDVYDMSIIQKWLAAVLSRNVKELHFILNDRTILFTDINWGMDDLFTHQYRLFTCQTLQVLQINARGSWLQLPSLIYLPKLKTLKLKNVNLHNYHRSHQLFASQAMEELVLDNCFARDDSDREPLCIIISAPKLQSLTIDESNVRLMYQLASTSFAISGPLTTFYYNGSFTRDYQLSCSSFIVMATLLFVEQKYMIYNVNHFSKLLNSLRLVKYLQLSACVVEGLSHVTLPVFDNLVSLEFSGGSVDLSYIELNTFLNNCPHLESLKIPEAALPFIDEETIIENIDHLNRVMLVVKYLKLSALALKGLSRTNLPIFRNLICLELSGYSVDLSCKELKKFLNRCQHLESLKISQWYTYNDEETMIQNVYRFNKVLNSLRFVKYLELPASVVKDLSHATFPIFVKLISLEFSGDSVDLSCEGLRTLLNKCPSLETLKFSKGISVNGDINCLLSPKFTCLSSLKNIMIGSIKGNTEELMAVHILLAKATSLETMDISVLTYLDVTKRKVIKTFLSGVSMGSKSCRLIFRRNGIDGLDEEEEDDKEERRSLNDFPDEVVCHVISFLPTDSAFQIGILWIRWPCLCKSLTNLEFQEWYYIDNNVNNVDYV